MGDNTFTQGNAHPDTANSPLDAGNMTVPATEHDQAGHDPDSGAPFTPRERKETEPAWQGVPL